jgi:hypothetical protein
MGFKLIKSDKKDIKLLDNNTFITFLLENHKSILITRSKSMMGDGISIPESPPENKKEFDFFFDEKKDAARKEVVYDLNNGIMGGQEKSNEERIVDRRRKGKPQ